VKIYNIVVVHNFNIYTTRCPFFEQTQMLKKLLGFDGVTGEDKK
jgi:hypothetical protein